MLADTTLAVESVSDLPPRTWRDWWLSWPKWLRIGCWAALGMVMLHAALAVRMAVGWIEPSEIVKLRHRHAEIRYFWEDQTLDYSDPEQPWSDHIISGLWGRSCANVESIGITWCEDDELQLIADHFPNLKQLDVSGSYGFSPETAEKLRNCSRLERLDLEHTGVNDRVVEQLADLSKLVDLSLTSTLITDASIPLLRRMKSLKIVEVGLTDVTDEAIEEWRRTAGPNPPEIYTDYDRTHPPVIPISIRWSDGTESRRIPATDRAARDCRIYVDGPIIDESAETGPDQMAIVCIGGRLRLSLGHSALQPFVKGNYRLLLEFAGFHSNAIMVPLDGWHTAKREIQFELPVTQEQALEAWDRERNKNRK